MATILIDMIKLREAMVKDPATDLSEAYYYTSVNLNGLKTIRELAAFRFTCRKCEDSPCIGVCPADALEKDQDGVITRSTNLCISCKSCVTICPFGTMMSDFFKHHRNRDLFCDLSDEKNIDKLILSWPPGTVKLTDSDEAPDKNIYRLNEKVLVREFLYPSEKK